MIDAKVVVEAIAQRSEGRFSPIVREINETRNLYISCNFAFEGSASNHETHNRARYALSPDQGRHVWLGQPHDIICIPMSISEDQ